MVVMGDTGERRIGRLFPIAKRGQMVKYGGVVDDEIVIWACLLHSLLLLENCL